MQRYIASNKPTYKGLKLMERFALMYENPVRNKPTYKGLKRSRIALPTSPEAP